VNTARSDDVGKLILRLAVGGLMLFHGIGKVLNGVGGISDMLVSKGLPGFMAYGVYAGEVLAPIIILIGFLTRPAAAVLAVNMVAAIALAHSSDIFRLGEHGEWPIELPMFYLLASLALVFLGSGRFSVSRGRRPLD
jgi:putative oxidoreductase